MGKLADIIHESVETQRAANRVANVIRRRRKDLKNSSMALDESRVEGLTFPTSPQPKSKPVEVSQNIEVFKSKDVSITVVDSHIIVRCPLLKNSFITSYENLPQKYKPDLLNWCYAIACLSFELNPEIYESPSDLIEKFSILPNENGGREYLFISFVAESFPLDHKYTIEDKEHLTDDDNGEIALFKGVLSYLVENLQKRNRRIVSAELATHVAIQDHELVVVETCSCTIKWKKDSAREQRSKDLATIFTSEVRAGKNPTLYYVIHLFRTFFYFFKALDWADLHASDCTFLEYQTNLQLLEDKNKLVESAAQEKLETAEARLQAIEARREDHEEEKSANSEEEKAKTISSLKAIARGESGSLEFSSNRSLLPPRTLVEVDPKHNSESAFDEVVIGNCDAKIESRQSKYLIEPGQPDIVSLAWIPNIQNDDFIVNDVENPREPKFIRFSKIFIEGVGNVIIPSGDTELKKFVDDRIIGHVRDRIATVIIKWKVDRYDQRVKLSIDALKIGSYQVLPWEFSPEKYQEIRNALTGHPGGGLDRELKVHIPSHKDKKFQDFEVTCRAESFLGRIFKNESLPKLQESLLSDIRDCIATLSDKHKSCLGQQLTVAEIQAKLECSAPTSPVGVDSDQWFPGLNGGFPGFENLEPRLPKFDKPGSSWKDKHFNHVKYESKLFDHIDFRSAKFNQCSFVGCSFINCSFRTAQFKQCNFKECTIRTCDFTNANLNAVYFTRCGIKRCNLDDAIQTAVSFLNSQVQGTLINFRS